MTEQSTIRLGNDVAGVVVRTGTPGAEVPARPLGLRATGQRPDRHLRGVIESPTCGRARKSLYTPAPAAWGHSRSSWAWPPFGSQRRTAS